MIIGQWLIGFDYLCKVCLHQFGYDINLIKRLSIFGLQNSFNTKDIFMLEQPLDFELERSDYNQNSTRVDFGQFPWILYS